LRRFQDFDILWTRGPDWVADPEVFAPIRLITRRPPPSEDRLAVVVRDQSDPILARLVDGHHRLFAARICGSGTLPAVVEVENPDPDELAAHVSIEWLADGRVRIDGWVDCRGQSVQIVELRSGDETLGRGAARIDPVSSDGDLRRVAAFRVETSEPVGELPRAQELRLVALSDWLPIGRVDLRLG
jgi:hypothetical protein